MRKRGRGRGSIGGEENIRKGGRMGENENIRKRGRGEDKRE